MKETHIQAQPYISQSRASTRGCEICLEVLESKFATHTKSKRKQVDGQYQPNNDLIGDMIHLRYI